MRGTATVRCRACGVDRNIPMEKYSVGDVLHPFPGGGDYGKCLKCGRSGLVVMEVPRVEPTKPVGWSKISEV
jgi:hypothetical protein